MRSGRERRAFRERQFANYFRDARPVTVDSDTVRQERIVLHDGRRVPASRVVAELPLRDLRHRLVGLADETGGLVALGTVLGLRPGGRVLNVLAPWRSPKGVVAVLQWGMLRVSPSGREEPRTRSVG